MCVKRFDSPGTKHQRRGEEEEKKKKMDMDFYRMSAKGVERRGNKHKRRKHRPHRQFTKNETHQLKHQVRQQKQFIQGLATRVLPLEFEMVSYDSL